MHHGTKPLALESYLGWLDLVVARHIRPAPMVERPPDDLDRVLQRLRALRQRAPAGAREPATVG